jgi:hypothetical protein
MTLEAKTVVANNIISNYITDINIMNKSTANEYYSRFKTFEIFIVNK